MQKFKTFRPWQPGQTSLLPPSPSDWLTADHQVYFLLDLVDELHLWAIVIPAQAKDPRGEKGFDPRMMTLLLLYAYCVGIVSSRRIERACYEDLAFRVLTANQQPDHSRISEFRRRNLEALSDLFVQILRLCQEAGMVSLGHVALDGTKVQANASKHKAMSHERMLKAEAQLEKEIRELMRKAEILDAQEDGKYGKGNLGSDLPKELQRREDRLKKIKQARQALEAEAAAAAARDRARQAAAAEAAVADAEKTDADDGEQQKLRDKAAKAKEKAEAARELAIEKAKEAGVEPLSGDNEVGRSATSSLAGWVSVGHPGADAQVPGDAGTTDEPPTQPVHGETTRWQQPGGCCRSGGHFSAQRPPDREESAAAAGKPAPWPHPARSAGGGVGGGAGAVAAALTGPDADHAAGAPPAAKA